MLYSKELRIATQELSMIRYVLLLAFYLLISYQHAWGCIKFKSRMHAADADVIDDEESSIIWHLLWLFLFRLSRLDLFM